MESKLESLVGIKVGLERWPGIPTY